MKKGTNTQKIEAVFKSPAELGRLMITKSES